MNAQDLKNSILQLAIQGKLVEQRKEEVTAKELLGWIKAEKEKLIKEGKLKKEKQLPEITEKEIPFEIPESWEWVRLGEISKVIHYGYTASACETGNCKLLRITDIQDNSVEWKAVPFCTVKESDYITYGLNNRDILIARTGGTIGKTYIVESLEDKAVFASYLIRTVPVENINEKYMKKYMESTLYWIQLKANSMGTGQPNVNGTSLKNLIVPIPPLEEQKRIVAKIEDLMPYIEKYGEAHSKLEEFNKKFPEDMQKSILQYAIKGKLVEQREEEGTAEELYQQIQEEKERLIKEGKIKKEKSLAEITEDEIPFEIPESWKWVRLSDVIDVRDGTHDTPSYLGSGYPLITGKDFYNGYFELSKTQYISKEDYDNIRKRSNAEVGDILFSMIGGNIGSMIIIDKENYFEMAIKNVALFKQYAYNMRLSKYLMYYLKSQVPKIKANANGGAQSFVPLKVLRDYLFPLPPLEEQKRIVAKIEEMIPLCQQLVK